MEAIRLPFLPLKGHIHIIFPNLAYHLDLTQSKSLETANKALSAGKHLILGFLKYPDIPHTTIDIKNVWDIGCEVVIKNIIDLQGNVKRISLDGIRRVKICTVASNQDLFTCAFDLIEESHFEMTNHLGQLAMYLQSLALSLESTTAFRPMPKPKDNIELSKFVDTIGNRIAANGEEKMRLLRSMDARKRIEILHMILTQLTERENERLAEQAAKDVAEKPVNGSTSNVEANHVDVATDPKNMEVQRLRRLLQEAEMPEEVRAVASNELKRLQMMGSNTSDFSVTVTYLDVMASLPWSKTSVDKIDIDEARHTLNEDHYGLKEPKERILEFLAVRKLTTKSGGAILCFSGPPGVGKAQPLDAKVLTPSGFVDMGDIHVGDKVCTPSGEISTVIGVYPQGYKEIFEVCLSDGAKTQCCNEHLWAVKTRDDRCLGKPYRVRSLKDIRRNLKVGRKQSLYVTNMEKKRSLSKYITSIQHVGSKLAQCLLIDHPDHLYITDDFIVTHNTSLGQSIARAMGRVFIRTSLGGVRDEAEIRGHRRTYIGALPGRILQEMRKAKVKNPVFMLDEVDKLGRESAHGNPAAALLEVLDPEQNHAFKDNYLELGFDLSQVFFIGTANNTYEMLPALRDRLEIVELPGYSAFAKSKIARSHLIPRQQEKNGLLGRNIEITNEGLTHIIEAYTSEAGVRTLERCCGSVFRKLAVYAATERDIPGPVDADMVKTLLGPPKLFKDKMAEEPSIGISMGLAWSTHGGSVLFIESVAVPGDGKIELTGNVGQVLQESAKAAHTWIRANAETFGINTDVANKTSIHAHIPAGATPKDGPSAGVALAVSIASLLSKRPVRNDIAMTGEISLHGRVMPVGGIVEKLLAAHRAGIREVIIPKDNSDSLTEVPEEIAGEMKIHLVDRLNDALSLALLTNNKEA